MTKFRFASVLALAASISLAACGGNAGEAEITEDVPAPAETVIEAPVADPAATAPVTMDSMTAAPVTAAPTADTAAHAPAASH